VFGLGAATRIYLAVGRTDMRKGFNGLFGLVRDRLRPFPTSYIGTTAEAKSSPKPTLPGTPPPNIFSSVASASPPLLRYGAPHLSARGTSTLLNNALLSTHFRVADITGSWRCDINTRGKQATLTLAWKFRDICSSFPRYGVLLSEKAMAELNEELNGKTCTAACG
jgi:hypothetical protein